MSTPSRSPESLFARWLADRDRGNANDVEELCRKHPEHADGLRALFTELERHEAGTIRARSERTPRWESFLEQLRSRGPTHSKYVVGDELARGGMGVVKSVYDGDIRRRLAMKVILAQAELSPAGDAAPADDKVLGRFLEEAQVTGQLDHPGVVPVHEVGIDDAGRVFFTMKLVRGDDLRVVIDRVHDARDTEWTLTRALNVMLRVCEAMAYAHSKGVIHRDLKPANVMVGPFGEVYVMDWGLARVPSAADQPTPDAVVTERALLTAQEPDSSLASFRGGVAGTPEYMPPEQAAGDQERMGPPADVYAVGAMLYHLLAGAPPYSELGPARDGAEKVERALAGPPSPIDRVAPDAAAELLAIVEKSMDRDPSDRYANMTELARDLRSFLENRVVEAYRTGPWAELMKWVQRNRALAATAAAAITAVITLAGWALVERNVARKNEAEAKRVADFQSRMLVGLDAFALGQTLLTGFEEGIAKRLRDARRSEEDVEKQLSVFRQLARQAPATDVAKKLLDDQILTRAADAISEEFLDAPRIEATLSHALASVYESLGLRDRALPHQSRAWALRGAELGPDHQETLESKSRVGRLLEHLGRFSEAEPLLREVMETTRRTLGGDHPRTLHAITNVGHLLSNQGSPVEAEALLRESLAGYRRVLGVDDPITLLACSNLGLLLLKRWEVTEAEALLTVEMEGHRRLFGDEHPKTLNSMINMAGFLNAVGRPGEAESLLRDAVSANRRVLGTEHPRTLIATNNLAALLEDRGRLVEAETLYLEVLESTRRTLGDPHPSTYRSLNNLAGLRADQGRFDEAEELYLRSLEGRRTVLGEDHPDTLTSIGNVGFFYKACGELAKAEPYYQDSYERRRRIHGPDHPSTLLAMNNLANLREGQGRLERAEELYRETLSIRREALGENHPDTLVSVANLASFLDDRGKTEEAEVLHREALEKRRRTLGERHRDTLGSMSNVALILQERGEPVEALALMRRASEGTRDLLGEQHPQTFITDSNLAYVLESQGSLDEAERLFRDILSRRRRAFGDENTDTMSSVYDVASVLEARGKLDEAEEYYREELAIARVVLGDEHAETLSSIYALGVFLQAQGRLDEAEAMFVEELATYRRVHGIAHTETLTSAANLAQFLAERGNHDAAAPLAREVLTHFSKLDPEGSTLLKSMTSIAERRLDRDDSGSDD